MKTKLLLPVLIVFTLLSLISCSKANTDSPDPDNPGTSNQIPASGILYVNDFIYVMNTDGTNPTKISLSKEYFGEDYPSSSADGKKIVFRRYSKGIVVKDASGEKVIMNDANTPIFTTWSGNSKIFYTRFNGVTQNGKDYVYSVNPDGTGDVQVSPVYNNVATPLDEGASVSPDNAYVVFSTNRTGNGGTIMKLKLSDGTSSYLTYSGTTLGESVICPAEHPTWSPNGSKIAFAAYPGYPDFQAKEQIYVMNPDGSGKTKLTNETQASCIYPSWSPDGTKIVFQKNYPGFSNCYEIWIMNADGSNAKALTDRNKTGYETHPAFIGKPR
jgi:Tol biopolymer transport system component